jgi:hypothetical protein
LPLFDGCRLGQEEDGTEEVCKERFGTGFAVVDHEETPLIDKLAVRVGRVKKVGIGRQVDLGPSREVMLKTLRDVRFWVCLGESRPPQILLHPGEFDVVLTFLHN